MSDIDFTINTENGFEVSLGDNPNAATGNKLLSNRFSITFLTNIRNYLLGNEVVTDSYGGNALNYVGRPQALNNIQSISSSITVAMNRTIDSIKNSQSTVKDPTEQLANAVLNDVSIVNNIVYATIELIPIKYSSSDNIYFTVPIITIK